MARFALGVLACLLVLTGPAAAQQPALDRSWSATHIDPGTEIFDLWSAPSGVGDTLVMYGVPGPTERAVVVHHGVAGQSKDLGTGYWNMTGVDGSPLHGAVAAWAGDGSLHIVQVPPGGSTVEDVDPVTATHGNYSYGRPMVRFGPAGDVVVVYLGSTDQGQRAMARIRPAGGAWSEPEAITPEYSWDRVVPRDVAVARDGTIVVGLSIDNVARVATRPPGGAFTLSEPLGDPVADQPWNTPRIGIDAAGTVVAAWLEGAALNDTGPVRVAFRAPGAAAFEDPVKTGVEASSYGHINLGVSEPGEVVLVVEAQTDNPYGGTHIEGLHAEYGLTHLRRMGPPAPLTGIWGSYPWFDMNARGDAVVVWYECCPMALQSRRRLPLGKFGPVTDVAPPIEFEGGRSGRWALGASLDDLGNARAAWVDSEPQPAQYFAGADGPLLDAALPEVGDVGDVIGPVVDLPIPEVLPENPSPWVPGSGTPPLPPPPMPVPLPAPVGPITRSVRPGAVDRLAPTLSVKPGALVARRRQLRLSLGCSELCGVRLRARAGRRAGRYIDAMIRPGERTRIALPVPARAHGKLRIEGLVADASGNLTRVSRAVTAK